MTVELHEETPEVPYRRATRWLLFGVPLLCLLLSTCGAGIVVNIDELRKKNLPDNGGGQVLVEAGEPSCWTLMAYQERHPEGSQGEPEDEVSEYDVDEEGLAPFEATGCGSDVVTLPADQVFGAVEIAGGNDGEAHPVRNLLVALWLTRRGARMGTYFVTPGSGPRRVYAAAADTPRGNPVSRARALQVTRSPRVRQAMSEQEMDPDAALRSAEKSFEALLDSQGTDVADYEALMRRARQDAEVALLLAEVTQRFLGDTTFPVHRAQDRWVSAFLSSLAALESIGGSLERGTTDALIDAAYDRQHDAIRAEIGGDYVGSLGRARAGLEVLRALRPARAEEIEQLADEIDAERARQAAAERAEEQAYQEWLDDLQSGSGSGYAGGLSCDGDGDGICYE